MMCQRNCGSTVEAALRAVPGVLNAEASFASESATVILLTSNGTTTTAEDLAEAVEDVGFEASVATTQKLYWNVEGMMCQRNCGSTVQNAMLSVPGVLRAEASFVYSQAWAEIAIPDDNSPTSSLQEEIADAIDCVGFDATVISEPEALAQQRQVDQEEQQNQQSSTEATTTPTEPPSSDNNANVIILSVEGMSCAVCTGKVERCLLKVPGVTTAFVSLATHRAELSYATNAGSSNNPEGEATTIPTVDQIALDAQVAVQTLGYPSDILSAGNASPMTLEDNAKTLEDAKHSELKAWRNLLILAVVLLLPMLCVKRHMAHLMMVHHSTTTGGGSSVDDDDDDGNKGTMARDYSLSTSLGEAMLVMAILSTISQFVVGHRYYKAAWNAGRDFGMDFLIVLGTTSSYVYSVGVWLWLLASHTQVAPDDSSLEPTFGTGAMLLTFVTFGKFLEAYAKGKTSSALEALMKLQPSWASRIVSGMEAWTDTTIATIAAPMSTSIHQDNNEEEQPPLQIPALEVEEIATMDVKIGDYLRVLPGARIPADGVIVALSSTTASPASPKSLASAHSYETASDSSSRGGGGFDSSSHPQSYQPVAFIDESAFSGEPFPVPKMVGDSVYGSSVNQLTVIIVRVTATGSNSVLAKIVRLMEDAQRHKAPIQALADQIASIFAPSVMGLAMITFIMWLILDSDADSNQERFFLAFLSAISVVVVACPCALGLATPTAVMVGTGVGASHGLLIKGGSVLEEMQAINTIVMDKTGTITRGRAILGEKTELVQDLLDPLLKNAPSKVLSTPSKTSHSKNGSNDKGGKHNLALWLATCAEQQSEHPLAKAVVNAAKSRWGGDVTCAYEGVTVEDFYVMPGSGVECVVSKPSWGSYIVRVGNKQWAQEPVQDAGTAEASLVEKVAAGDITGDSEIAQLRELGQIGVYVSVLQSCVEPSAPDLLGSPISTVQSHDESYRLRRVVGVLGIVDPIADQAKSTVSALRLLGVDVWLCTGDHIATARAVAKQVGIDEANVRAGVKPEEKAELVSQLQARTGWTSGSVRQHNTDNSTSDGACSRVAFVGDGINDSIALARANAGIAIGAGTEVAVEAADIVLVRSNLHDVVIALHLSKVVFRRIRMNFAWAMLYNVIALPFAAGLLYPFTDFRLPPEYAGLMMAFSSVSVVTSSLLLRNYTRPIIHEDGTLEGGSGILEKLMLCCHLEQRQLPGSFATRKLFKGDQGYESVDLEMV